MSNEQEHPPIPMVIVPRKTWHSMTTFVKMLALELDGVPVIPYDMPRPEFNEIMSKGQQQAQPSAPPAQPGGPAKVLSNDERRKLASALLEGMASDA